jgi:HEAT repeat protein
MDVIAALTDPADAERVRKQLETETDPSVREAILRTLGRLQDPASIPVLIQQLAEAAAPKPCVVEAALSLGMLGAKDKSDPAAIDPAIEPLKQRFATAAKEDLTLRAALLSAMANLGRAEFAPEFNANLDTPEPELLLPALDGIRETRDSSRLERVLALITHADPRVRRRAIQAAAALGDPSHAEAIFARVSPAVESSDNVRPVAWDGLLELLGRSNAETRLLWSERMLDFPERREAYLLELEREWSQSQPASRELAETRRRLAAWFDSSQRYAESLPRLIQLFTNSTDGVSKEGVAAPLLRAELALGRYEDLCRQLPDLVGVASNAERDQIAKLLLEHCRTEIEAGRNLQLAGLQAAIKALSPDALGPQFHADWQTINKTAPKSPVSGAVAPPENGA